MHKLIALTLLPALLLTGCPLGCGGYTGSGDRMLRRGNDALLLCENGGYVAMFENGSTLEGRYEENLPGSTVTGIGVDGPSGARLFSLTFADDGTATADGMGDGTWLEDSAFESDQVALDHADVQCNDLSTRAWWNTFESALPVATAFSKPPDAFATVADCQAAQEAGDVPADALCEDQVLLCPDGSIRMNTGAVHTTGTYNAYQGVLSVQPSDNSFTAFSGVFAMSGTLTTGGAQGVAGTYVWHSISTTTLANGLSCQ
jgi:hypothetical protein